MNLDTMKRNYFKLLVLGFVLFGCDDSLTNVNINPNELSENDINPAYVLTNILSNSAAQISEWTLSGNPTQCILSEAAQFTQQDYSEFEKSNAYAWVQKDWGYRDFYKPLANCIKLKELSSSSPDSLFLKGTALTMSAYWFGFFTSAWGDVPYKEAMQGHNGINNPKFDSQKIVFKGILNELEKANEYFSKSPELSKTTIDSDIMYGGDSKSWQAFANSLHLRFLMRLSEKKNEMQSEGIDIVSEFKRIVDNPDHYPIITSSDFNAKVDFLGNVANDSWKLGPLNTTNNPLEFYRRKASDPLVQFLKRTADPRLTVWFSPVEIPTRIQDKGSDVVIEKDENGTVRRYFRDYSEDIDTSLFVGLKIAYPNPISYNSNNGSMVSKALEVKPDIYAGSSANPFVSYLNEMYQKDAHKLVNTVFIGAFEVCFLLSEGVERGWINGSSEDYFINGIKESLSQYEIENGDLKKFSTDLNKIVPFDLDNYLQLMKNQFENSHNKLETIIEQHWSSHFGTTNMEAWFNWRRTGFPDLEDNIVSGSKGKKLPLRFPYGDNPKNFNTENVAQAVKDLDPSVDDQWSKMWLLQ